MSLSTEPGRPSGRLFFALPVWVKPHIIFHAGAGPVQLGALKMENENAFLQQLASALVVLMQPEIEKQFQSYAESLEREIESAIDEKLPAEVEDQVYSQIEDKLEDAIEGALDARLDGAGVEDEVAARIDAAVEKALPGALREALLDLITPALASLRPETERVVRALEV